MGSFGMDAAGVRRVGVARTCRMAAGAVVTVMLMATAACADAEEPSGSGATTPAQTSGDPTNDGGGATSSPADTEPASTDPAGSTTEATSEDELGSAPPTQGSDATTSTPQDGASTGRTVALEYVSVDLPAGWQVQDMGGFEYEGGVQPQDPLPPHQWCLAPPDPGVAVFDCAGVSIVVGGDWLPGHNGQPFEVNQPFGWYAAAPPVPCPFDPAGGDLSTEGDGLPVQEDVLEVAAEPAHYAQWEASCEQGDHSFSPRSWFLPEGEVLVTDVLGHEETTDILTSMEVSPF